MMLLTGLELSFANKFANDWKFPMLRIENILAVLHPVFVKIKRDGQKVHLFLLVPLTGLEPVRYRYRGILSPLCLPIPPQRHTTSIIILHSCVFVKISKLKNLTFSQTVFFFGSHATANVPLRFVNIQHCTHFAI